MGFSIGAFARGFASAAVEDKREKEDEVKDLIKTSYTVALEEAKALREKRTAKREKLKDLGNQLKMMNLSDSAVAGILSTGVSGAERQIEILTSAAEKFGPDFDVNTFVTASEDANLTIDDAIDRIMGTPAVPKAGASVLPEGAQVKTLFGTTDRAAREQLERLQGTFGEDFAQLQAEISGERQYGELPEVSIDYSMLGEKTAEEKTAQEIRELQLQKLQAEIADIGKPEDLTATQEQSLVRGMNNILAPLVAKRFGTELSWDGANYVLPEDASLKAQAAMDQSLTLARAGVEQIRSGVYYTDALGMQQDLVGTIEYDPTMAGVDEVITPDTIPPYDPASQTPTEFAESIVAQMNISGMNPADKKKAREKLRSQLLDNSDMDLSFTDANKLVDQLIPL